MTVAILVNGKPIFARSAVRAAEQPELREGCKDVLYNVDDGNRLFHNPEDGAVPLAIQMLKLIKTEGVDR